MTIFNEPQERGERDTVHIPTQKTREAGLSWGRDHAVQLGQEAGQLGQLHFPCPRVEEEVSSGHTEHG